ncbi:TPA: FaeA/PapI family transcriptional regulator [Escherichia coli]
MADTENILVGGQMNKDFDGSIVNFMKDQEESFRETFFSTREIADAVRLTIYQVREHLDALQSFSVVEKVNSGRENPGQWRLL